MANNTGEPHFLLDGARVICYATLGGSAKPPAFSFVAGGVTVDPHSVSRVAISQNLVDDAVFLLHCNERWETVAAAPVRDAESGQRLAKQAYEGVELEWHSYRSLTPQEQAEIETTTRFLKDLAAGMLDE